MKAIKTPPQEPTSGNSVNYSDVLNWLVENSMGLINPATQLTNALSRAVAPIYNEAKQRIGTNINPYSYDDPLNRLYSAVVKNEPEQGSFGADPFRLFSGGPFRGKIAEEVDKERIDLLQMYLGLPQQYGSVGSSKYSPSEESIFSEYNDGRDLYSSPATEKGLMSRIQGFQGSPDELNQFLDAASSIANYHDQLGNVLGNFRLGRGSDEKGSYIEYGDVWDLNPFSANSTSGNKFITSLENSAVDMLGLSPATMYGRIYYDPETRDIIR